MSDQPTTREQMLKALNKELRTAPPGSGVRIPAGIDPRDLTPPSSSHLEDAGMSISESVFRYADGIAAFLEELATQRLTEAEDDAQRLRAFANRVRAVGIGNGKA